jgi:N-acetylneuraminic acid mutarotase
MMQRFFTIGWTLVFLSLAPLVSAQAEWREGTALPTAVSNAVTTEMDGKLFIMSGKLGQGLRTFFEQYDIRSDGWRPLTPLPVGLSHFAMASGTGRVIVSGGRENETARLSADLWMYAPDTAVWLKLGHLPSSRADHVSVFDRDRVFLFGGIGQDAARVQSYNLGTGKWSTWKTPMPIPVSNAAFTRLGDEVIIAGGKSAAGRPVKAVQAFHLKTGKWRQLPELPIAVIGGALGVLNDGLHFAGGFSPASGKVMDSHNRLVGNRWQRQAPLPGGGRHQMAYHASEAGFILIGGAIGGGFYALFTASDRVSIFRP